MLPRRPKGRIIALEGPSGIGKSSVALILGRDHPGVRVLPEAYARLADPPSLAVPNAAELLRVERRFVAEERRRFAQAVRWRRAGWTVVADTGFLGPLTYTIGMAALDPSRDVVLDLRRMYGTLGREHRVGLPDLTIMLDASRSTIRRRLDGDPAGHPDTWRSRHSAVGEREQALWMGSFGRALGPRFVRISAAGAPGYVADRVWRIVEDRSGPSTLSEETAARRLVRLVGSAAVGKG